MATGSVADYRTLLRPHTRRALRRERESELLYSLPHIQIHWLQEQETFAKEHIPDIGVLGPRPTPTRGAVRPIVIIW